jgi:hypothetical protein
LDLIGLSRWTVAFGSFVGGECIGTRADATRFELVSLYSTVVDDVAHPAQTRAVASRSVAIPGAMAPSPHASAWLLVLKMKRLKQKQKNRSSMCPTIVAVVCHVYVAKMFVGVTVN